MYILKKFMTFLTSNDRQSNKTMILPSACMQESETEAVEKCVKLSCYLKQYQGKTTLILTKCPILDMHLDLSPARVSCPCKTSSSSLCGSITSVDSSSYIMAEFSSADMSRFVFWHPLTDSISIPSTGKGV